MSDAVLQFLIANLALSGGILMVLVLRKPVRSQFGARVGYALWVLPLLAAGASFLPPRVVEIVAPAMAVPAFEPIAPVDTATTTPAAAIVVAPPAAAVASPPVTIDPWAVGGLIWIAGMVAMAAWLAAVQMRFMAGVRRGEAGPAVVGFLRPRIVTPADFEMRYDPGERRVILTHETIHLDRNDARINALAALVRCVCWFNPLVHLAAHFLRIDQEMACDAAVVERHPKARKLYADALLKTQLAAHPLPLGCYWPAGTEHPLMERIEMLKQHGPGVARRSAGLAVLALIAIAAGCTTWAAKPAETRFVEAPAQQVEAPAQQDALRLLAPPSVQMPQYWMINFNADDPVIVRGKVIRLERDYDLSDGTLLAAVWIEADRITSIGGDWPSDPRTKVWRVTAGAPGRWPGWADRQIVGQDVIARGYRGFDKTCKPACLASSPDWTFPRLPALQPFADVTWTRDRDEQPPEPSQASADQPLRIAAIKHGLLEVLSAKGDKYVHRFFEPGESYLPRVGSGWTVSADDGSAFEWRLGNRSLGLLAAAGGPVQSQSVDLVLLNPQKAARVQGPAKVSNQPRPAVYEPPQTPQAIRPASDEFDSSDPIHLVGKVEKIEFGATTYVAFVRAASIAACPQGPETVNTALWELAPTPYWGDRDAVIKDIMNASVYVRGFNAKDKSCAPNCRMLARGVFKSMRPSGFSDPALTCSRAPQPVVDIEPQKPPAPEPPAKKPIPETGDAVKGLPKNSTEEEIIEKKKSEAEGAEVKRQAMKSRAEFEQAELKRQAMKGQIEEALRGGKAELRKIETTKDRELMDKLRSSDEVDKERIAAAEAKRLKERVAALEQRKAKAQELERFDRERIAAAEAKRLKDRAATPKEAPSKPPEPTSPPAAPSIPLPQPTSAPQAPPGPSIPFARYFDADAPVMLKGRVTAIDMFEGHAMLRVEEIQTTTPGVFSFPKPDVTKMWRVVLGRLDAAPAWARDPTLIGKVVEIRGYRGKDKDCGADCMMSGRDVILSGERLQGWAVPERPKPAPPQLKPI